MQARPEASAVIWDWRAQEAGGEAPGGGREAGALRWRGTIQALVGAGVGATVFALWSPLAGTVVMSIAGAILLAALLSPTGAFAMLERAFAALGAQVARALTFVLMTIIFYTVFLPFGALFRRGRRDPMKRFPEADAETYWSSREQGRAGSSLRTRQY